MTEVTDLDALVPDRKRVRLGGKEYTLPGDLPMDIFLRVQRGGEAEDENEAKALNIVLDAMVDLFAWEYPDGEGKEQVRAAVREVLLGRGVAFCIKLVRGIYAEQEAQAQEMNEQAAAETEAGPSQPPVADGTPSTPPSQPTPVPAS